GLIVGVFTYLSYIIGLAAALKLSVVAASHIKNVVSVSDKWMPFLSFLLVFVLFVFVVRWLGKLLQAFFKKIMLGWLNRLGGAVLFILLYLSIFGIFLFYITQMHLIQPETLEKSVTFQGIKKVGVFAIDGVGFIVPGFKNLFEQLEIFFAKMAESTTA
ncbi:MAG: CvpA family protein, partial [Niabella sp.]